MMNRVCQIYNYYVKPHFYNKGQNLVEYALLLAIVVGISYVILQYAGLADSIKAIFDSTNKVLDLVWKMVPFTGRFPSKS